MPAAVQFYPLRVARVDPLTADAAAVTFSVPDQLADRFDFRPGQSLTVRRQVGGREERRSYSICAPAGCPVRIGVREVAGGVVSGWLVRDVRAGDVVEALPPSGSFTPDLRQGGEHVLIAAGSGITPVLSIAASLLRARDDTTVTLVYGNRRSDTVMFADEVADIKDAYPARMRLVHVLSREPQEVGLFTGRLDAAKLRELLTAIVPVSSVGQWWLCGPFGMVADAIAVLGDLGVPRSRVHRELFYVEEARRPRSGTSTRRPVPAPRRPCCWTGGPAPSPSRPAPRCSTPPSESAPTCPSPARAASAAPAGRCCAKARSRCAATTRSSPRR
jgi:ring-1,2-phenylacetyl-CoA epoxidase subunit PaaE